MLCALKTWASDIKSNGGLKLEPLESSSSVGKSIISSLPQCLWSPNLVRCWLAMTGSHPTWSFDQIVSRKHVTNKNHYVSITRVPMATKLGRVVTCNDGFLPIKPHDPLITWCCKITLQTKIFFLHFHSAHSYQTW